MNSNFLETKFTVNNFITSFEFFEENNLVGSNSYFKNDIQYKFKNNSILKYLSEETEKQILQNIII